jgi:hypothetical protein
MDEAGFDPDDYPAIRRWFARVEAQPGFIAMGEDGAIESIAFDEYLAERNRQRAG